MSGGIGRNIDQIHAFVSVHADGDEGIIGMRGPDGSWIPLVGADMKRVDQLREYAQGLAKRSGKPVRLLKFSVREVLETFEP